MLLCKLAELWSIQHSENQSKLLSSYKIIMLEAFTITMLTSSQRMFFLMFSPLLFLLLPIHPLITWPHFRPSLLCVKPLGEIRCAHWPIKLITQIWLPVVCHVCPWGIQPASLNFASNPPPTLTSECDFLTAMFICSKINWTHTGHVYLLQELM